MTPLTCLGWLLVVVAIGTLTTLIILFLVVVLYLCWLDTMLLDIGLERL